MTEPIQRPRPPELECTAYHEAGHAVAALALGLSVNTISIVPDPDGECAGFVLSPGVLGYETSSSREQKEIARRCIVRLYAGMEAQRLVDPDPADYHDEDDEDNAFDLAREYALGPRGGHVGDDRHRDYLERLRVKARRLIHRHRAAVDRLAEELLAHKELSGAEVERIVRPFLP
jgi:ATP-dependent Zn protease